MAAEEPREPPCPTPAKDPDGGWGGLGLQKALGEPCSGRSPHPPPLALATSRDAGRDKWAELLHELAAARAELSLAREVNSQLSLVRQVGETVSSVSALSGLAQGIVDLVVDALGFEGACLMTRRREGGLHPTAHRGTTDEQRRLVAARLDGWLESADAAGGKLDALQFGTAGQSVAAVPLRVASEVVGVLSCGRPVGAGPIGRRDLCKLEIVSRQAAVALKNARLAEDLRALFLHTVQSLAAAIDAKDRYTRGHSERVSGLCRELAAALGLEQGRVEDLHIAGVLHDVGKIAVPEQVLTKHGRLDDVEWEDMRRHPAKGAEIVGHVPELTHLLPAIRHHHERYGGNGYPDGLTADKIPQDARILAICDAFDAITSERTYRAARSPMAALGEIHRHRSTQFDPEVADCFIEHAARSDLLRRGVGCR